MQNWPIQLFNKSVLKQRKFKEITELLGATESLRCLDVGGDNGVISYLLRQRGGTWASADLDGETVEAIRSLVETNVYQLTDGAPAPFADDEFDRVVVIDFLEHVEQDDLFVRELGRILKPGGRVLINVPHHKDSLLRRFRLAIGQTDEEHGHVRPGYTVASLRTLLGDDFVMETHHTYSRFFSELIDTVIRLGVSLVKNGGGGSPKGQIVTGQDLHANRTMFRIYSLIYPLVWLFSKLDHLLAFTSGYMLIVRARKA